MNKKLMKAAPRLDKASLSKKYARLAVSSADRSAVLAGLQQRIWTPAEARALDAIMAGTPLTVADRKALQRMEWETGLSVRFRSGIAAGLQQDSDRKWVASVKDKKFREGSRGDRAGGFLGGSGWGGADSSSGGWSSGDWGGSSPLETGATLPSPAPAPAITQGSVSRQDIATDAESTPPSTEAPDPGGMPLDAPLVVQASRFLRVQNNTEEKLTVYLQFRALDDEGKWAWYPADPSNTDKALSFFVEPGQGGILADKGNRISASRVRLWARAASNAQWLDYASKDLWLVTEVDGQGRRCYSAPEMETFTFTFSR